MQSTMNYSQSSRPSTITGSYGHGSPYRQNQYQTHSQLYTQTPPPSTDNLGYNQTAMNTLAQAFGATNLASNMPVASGKQNNGSFGANAANANVLAMHPNGQVYYHQLPDGTVVMSGMNNFSHNYQQYAGAYNLGASYGSYLPQAAYNGYAASMAQGFANTSRSAAWGSSQNVPVEVPDLAAPRRNSPSSEEHSPGPHTPYNYGTFPSGTYAYPAVDNSLSPWTEPSPTQLALNFPFEHYWRNRDGSYDLVDYYTITRTQPAIPVAVPAKLTKDSGRGTFDKILDNEHGTTNVYIRGLHPDTTDEKLHGYGSRFGDILRCKAIIDLSTGGCKGCVTLRIHAMSVLVLTDHRFGFVEYHNYTDAENCIRCFYYLGYEAKYAKVCVALGGVSLLY